MLVDDADFVWLNQLTWHAHRINGRWYADSTGPDDETTGNPTIIRAHRLILNAPDGVEVVHRDGNGLNNQRYNLRLATYAQQNANNRKRADNTSGFKGVTWRPRQNKYAAQIQVRGVKKHLGYRTDPAEAHALYCAAASHYFGAFARC